MKRPRILVLSLCALLLFSALAPQASASEDEPIQPRVADEDEPYIKVGFYASLTGSAFLLGQMGQQGCRLAVEQINNSGGINGKFIRLIEYDDQTDPDTACSIVRRMIEEDRVDAIVGSHTSGNLIHTAVLTEQAHVLQVGLGTSYLWTNVGYRYLFRSTGNSASYDEAIFSSIKEKGYERIAVYYCTTEYAQAGAQKLMQRIQDDPSMQLVWARSNDITQTDFEEDLLSFRETDADALILYATSENAGTQLQQLRQIAGYYGPVYAPEAFANQNAWQEAGESIAGLVYTCSSIIPDSPSQARSPKEQQFLEAFIKMYGTMPVAETAYRGYDAMMLLAEVFRTTKSMDSEDLRQAMEQITDYEGLAGTFDFSDGSGDGLDTCYVVTVTDTGEKIIDTYHREKTE